MPNKIADLRVAYETKPLEISALDTDPFRMFQSWFDEASDADLIEPNAMNLATTDSNGQPSARMVLLKGFDQSGFVFYTNYLSQKGKQLAQNPHAALVFWWDKLFRQVRIQGRIERVDPGTADAYFKSRPRGSQIGAHVSNQSEIIADYSQIEKRFADLSKQYEGREISRPDNWGGYLLQPDIIEFWQGRPNRLHDRFRYSRQESGDWRIERLSP